MIKKYKDYIKEGYNHAKIQEFNFTDGTGYFCPENFDINDYEIEDNKLNVNEDVILSGLELKKIPFKFNIVKGNFTIADNNITNLSNSPYSIDGNFICENNKITSLENGPKFVFGDYICYGNKLIESMENYPLCIISGNLIFSVFLPTTNIQKESIFKKINKIVKYNRNLFIPLLKDKIAFHKQLLKLEPDIIKYYKDWYPISKQGGNLLL